MALPSNGAIDLEQIYQEALAGGYSGGKDLLSLSTWTGWVVGPDGTAPHEMVGFYNGQAQSPGRVNSIAAAIGPTVSTDITYIAHINKIINHGDGYVVGVAQRGQSVRRAFVISTDTSGILSYHTLSLTVEAGVDQSSIYTNAVAAGDENHFMICASYELNTNSANDSMGIWCISRNGTTLEKEAFLSFTDGTSMLNAEICYLCDDATNFYYLVCYSRDVNNVGSSFDLKARAVIVDKVTKSISLGTLYVIDANSTHSENYKLTIVASRNSGSTARFSIFVYNGAVNNYYPHCTYDILSDTFGFGTVSSIPESGTVSTSRFATSGWGNLLMRGMVHPDINSAVLDDTTMIFMGSGSTETDSTISKSMYRLNDNSVQFADAVSVENATDSYRANSGSPQIRCDFNLLGDSDMCVAFCWRSVSTGDLKVGVFVLKPNISGGFTLVPDLLKSAVISGDSGNELNPSIAAIRKNEFVIVWRDEDSSGQVDMALVTVSPS